MKIALCVKQVPDTSDIKWTENNTMKREGVESILNPYDVYALELALKIKKQYGAEITVFTMGVMQASEMLKNIIALGADKGVLISDKKFAGADTYATGKTLSTAIKKVLPDFDLIVCGQFAIDGDTAQTGPCIAAMLDIPQVTYVKSISEFDGECLIAERFLDDGKEKVKVKLPALICVLQDVFEPSRAKINDIICAQNTEIAHVSFDDLGILGEDVGIKGSPTYVSKAFRPETSRMTEKCQDADELFEKLKGVLS